ARLLQDVLRAAAEDGHSIAKAQADFMARVGAVLETPWDMSTRADLAFPETRGERPDNFEEGLQFESALFRAAHADPVVHRALVDVAQLLESGSRLQEPDIQHRIKAVAESSAA